MDNAKSDPQAKRAQGFDWLRAGVHALGLARLFQLAVLWLLQDLTANPIQFLEQRLGRSALALLVLSLAITPLVTLTGWTALKRHRRTLGLYAFGYAALHFLTFVVLDYELDWPEMLRLTGEKPFILVGTAASFILLALAVTSFSYWKKRLGKGWKWLHRLVYLAALLAVVHYLWAQKGSLASLSGNILAPLVVGVLVIILLVARIPAVRRQLANLKYEKRVTNIKA
jgi:sulfoxide reductase heme-binding subunit YedZ